MTANAGRPAFLGFGLFREFAVVRCTRMEMGTKWPLTGPKSPINHKQGPTEQHRACLLQFKCHSKCNNELLACFSHIFGEFRVSSDRAAGDLTQLSRPIKHPQRRAAVAIRLTRANIMYVVTFVGPPGPCGASQGLQLRQNPSSIS
jgi:hypothetical protein